MANFIWGMLENLLYDFAKGAIMSAPVLGMLYWAFGKLKEFRQAVVFFVGSSLTLGLALFFISGPTKVSPDLSTITTGWLFGGALANDSGATEDVGEALVIGAIEIVNSGNMPSVARDYKLIAKVGETVYPSESVACPKTLTFQPAGANFSITLYGKDALYDKTDPILIGGSVAGLLCFAFRGLAQNAFGSGTVFTFEFVDAMGHQYDRTDTIGPAQSSQSSIRHFPGIEQDIKPISP
ncbi:MAG: hypothetical protein ACLQBA_27000 [Candidatus Binataceae bacterium]